MARLRDLPGLERTATDHSGTFLRVRARDVDAIASARAAVRAMGHETEELPADDARRLSAATEWYDETRLHELSREEAGVLADEVTSAFARDAALTPPERQRLRGDVADALMVSLSDDEERPRHEV